MLGFFVNREKLIFLVTHAHLNLLYSNLCTTTNKYGCTFKLCINLLNSPNKRSSVGAKFFALGKTQEGHAHFTHQARKVKIRKSEPEGRRDLMFSLK
jgi:hypothetical protein